MSMRMLLTLWLCLSCGRSILAQHRVQTHPTGTVSQRTLLQIQNGRVEFVNASALPLADLYSFGQLRQQANRGWVVLRCGEVIVADRMKLSKEGVEIQSLLWQPLTILWKDVRAVIRSVPKILSARDRLLESIFDDEARQTIDWLGQELGTNHISNWVNEPSSQAEWDAWGYVTIPHT